MQKFITLFHFLLLTVFVFSCSQKKAPIVNRGSSVYDRNSVKNKYKSTVNLTAKNITEKNLDDNFSKKDSEKSIDYPKTISVAKSDTVYSISRKYNVPLRELISQNNLEAPYILKVGDKIKLPQDQYYCVTPGDTLYSISRKYDMNVNSLIAMNSLTEPYSAKVGQMLKVNNSTKNSGATSATENVSKSSIAYSSYKKTEAQKLNSKPESEQIADKNNRFSWPLKGQIISKFGAKPGGLYNDGINIKAKNGDPVKATEDGIVAYVGNELRGYGNLIIVKHADGWISAYAHLDKTKVKRGVRVEKGQSIATVGSTGNVKSPQLYFGLRKGREAVNPQLYL